ncbi:hypothetical protein CEXT_408391 [Caerostris extrusa]|uniref:Uncharacterized protein n=1 Tax=Caerostris extrusa TaxID=172846 RepID=A0AAV4SB58_CAEEX|nr:hypothetical protein CEXT_408391 [Caerostris extrusa]
MKTFDKRERAKSKYVEHPPPEHLRHPFKRNLVIQLDPPLGLFEEWRALSAQQHWLTCSLISPGQGFAASEK